MSEYPIRLQSVRSIVRPDADAQTRPNGKFPVLGADRAHTVRHVSAGIHRHPSLLPRMEWKVPSHGKIVSVFD